MIKREDILDTLDRLVKIPSISGTEKENLAVDEIYKVINEIEYFKNTQNSVGIQEIQEDIYGRKFVWALLKGQKEESRDTIVLSGHLDVVDIQEFAHLKNLAFDFKEYTKRVEELLLDEDAKNDLKSGDWIFGRGTADMKYGLVLYIELLRQLSKNRDFKGNILFLAVPGEESNSEGMLGAVPYLLNLKEKLNLNYKGLFISECCTPKFEGDNSKKLYIGSVGKIMPTFFCVGKATHVGNPFGGLNPNLMISEINKLVECNVDLCDRFSDDITPPPVCLKQEDLKDLYSVQTPLYAYSYYNLMTLSKTPEEIMDKLKEIGIEAFNNSLEIANKNFNKYSNLANLKGENNLNIEPIVISFDELYKDTINQNKNFEIELNKKIKLWKTQKLDNQTIGIKIIKETFESYPYKKPMIIIAYNVPYYPNRHMDEDNKNYKEFLSYINKTIKYAKDKYNVDIKKENFFMGISDLSYTGLDKDFNINNICENMVGINSVYKFPNNELKKLDIPSAIFAGFGKDFHKYSERLNVSYSMDIVPKLYLYLLKDMLK